MRRKGKTRRQPEDIVRPAPERLRRDGLERLDPLPDVNGSIGRPWKMPDTLARMLRAGSITRGMQAAGLRFSRSFFLAQLDPLWAADLARVPNGRAVNGGGAGYGARDEVLAALDALGGIQSPGGSCAWHVLGCEWTIEHWCGARTWGMRRIQPETGAGILLADLGILKFHYERLTRGPGQ